MLLNELVPLYSAEKLAGSPPNTITKHTAAVRHFGTFLKRPATLDDLTEPLVKGFPLWAIRQLKLSTNTASCYHSRLLALWRFACDRGLVTIRPTHQKLEVPWRIPIAWSREELARLYAALAQQPGEIGGCPARLWWTTLHCCQWDTGERIGALFPSTWDALNLESGWLVIRAEARKGHRQDKAWRLHPETVTLLRQFRAPERRRIWPWPWTECSLWRKYREILQAAGLPSDRAHMFHCVRKSVASHFKAAGGDATELLGHSSPEVTRTYLDPTIVKPQQASDLLFRPDKAS